MIEQNKRYLVSTLDWFHGKDGEIYKAAWGTCRIISMEDAFGFKPSRPSTNWFMKIGDEDNHIIVGGCQIFYCVRCEERPWSLLGKHKGDALGREMPDNRIYFAEDE